MLTQSKLILAVFLTLTMILTGCNAPTPAPTPQPLPSADVPTAVPPTAEPTPEPRVLNVCLAEEPKSLYMYASSSRATWSVLEALYDGPFDSVNYAGLPVIVEQLPSLSGGDAVWERVTITPGQTILDADGNLITMQAGMRYLPAGCYSADCVAIWDGAATVEMDQMVVTYKIKPGITWSDGAPLKASDSVFAYQVAADPKTPVSRWLIDRTDDYMAQDDQTVQWRGIPGYHPARLDQLFFTPMPQHVYGSLTPEAMLTDDTINRRPLGWGAYILDEWTAGQQMTLSKNPSYFRAAEGLPYYDKLIFKFIPPTPDGNIASLTTGECDIVDVNPALTERLENLQDEEKAGRLKALVSQGPVMEQLVFGIKPAQYDDGYAAWGGDRPDYFSDLNVRKALAMCIDRNAITADLLEGFSSVPASYLPYGDPALQPDLQAIGFDPEAGKVLLDQAGWKDFDNDPATPRVAAGVQTVPDGTPLQLTYTTTSAPLRIAYMEQVASMLRECGVSVTQNAVGTETVYQPGPDGLVFGRKFDLATMAWNTGNVAACAFYTSSQIPAADNRWLGVNVGGFTNADFDRVCQGASFGALQELTASHAAQQIFNEQLPVLPLYYHLNVALARPDLCGAELQPSTRSVLANIEMLGSPNLCQ